MEEMHGDAGTLAFSGVESPSSEPASSRRRAGAQKRKASSLGPSNSLTTPSKRITRARQVPSNLAATASDFSTGGVAAPAPASSVKAEITTSLGVPRAEAVLSPTVAEKLNKESKLEALEASFEAEFEAIRSRGANAHVVPNHCGWFSWNHIHPIEERTMPTFFDSKTETRTPDIYMEIRNWILKKFHANPNVQIELEDLSELESRDSDSKQEVMEFLDHWGLINFHPYLPSAESSLTNTIEDKLPNDPLIEKLYRFETLNSCSSIPPKTTIAPALPSGLFPEKTIAEDLMKPEVPAYHCNSCSADCSRKRYHCQKQADFDLCTECFNNGKFDSDMSSSDFILMEPAEVHGVSGGKWTDQETLLLLEALELYKENWNEIAEHVATKTKAQCILHFLQMPIEDTFLDFNEDLDSISKKPEVPPSKANDLAILEDAAEVTNGKIGVKEEQPSTSHMEAAKKENAGESNMKNSKVEEGREMKDALGSSKSENGHLEISESENCALKALKEAFEAIGSLSIPECSFSFTDVGNPVMALAAFLARLVGPEIASASAHNSLKAISGSSPSMELAARYCFFLEDPPDSKEELNSERGSISGTRPNDESQHAELNDSAFLNEPKNAELSKDDRENFTKGSDLKSMVGVEPTSEVEEGMCRRGSSKQTATTDAGTTELPPLEKNSLQEPATFNCVDETALSMKDGETKLDPVPLSKNGPLQSVVTSAFGRDMEPRVAQKDADSVPECHLETSSFVGDNGENRDPSGSLHSEKSVPLQPSVSNSVLSDTGEVEVKVINKEVGGFKVRRNDDKIDKLKNAAVTALSAATVKARLLAKEEEEQIRQLAAFLIEKQLHKLESKLAFFDEMDNVIVRVREQLDRSKQRLYQERAQIIAARLGLPASSGKAIPPGLPTGRLGTTMGNSVPRPPSSMTSQRPPISRSMGTVSSSSLFVSSTVAGNYFRPST